MTVMASYWTWVPIAVAVPLSMLIAIHVWRATPERRRSISFFMLGFMTFALYQLAAQFVVRLFSS